MTEVADKAIEIAKEHLGFAGEKFLRRQCSLHLDKELDEIEEDDLEDLATWVKNTAILVTDQETSKKMKREIRNIK